jgi:dTDP-4-amino-4,6-dideoxygalactose transaminase
MIPRTKVNYRFPALISACLISESRDERRKELASRLSHFVDTPHVLLTASGRGALYVLLSCLPHRRVLVPAYTCKAVVEAAQLAGKEILFSESEEDGFNMATRSLQQLLTPDTILVATHQFGIPCDIRSILAIAKAHGAFVIEDAAASLGTRVEGQLTGTFGDAAFFSFDSTKLVNAPLKAGFLTVRDPNLFTRCQSFAASNCHPMPLVRKLRYVLFGSSLIALEHPMLYRLFHNLKFHWRGKFTDDSPLLEPNLGPFYLDQMAEWQAALLLPQIECLDLLIATRRRLYSGFLRQLQGAKGFDLPPVDVNGEWAPIRFPIRVHCNKLEFYRRAAKLGIDFAFSFTFIASPGNFVRSHRLADSVLDLPFYERLTENEIEKIVAVLRELDRTSPQESEYAVPLV